MVRRSVAAEVSYNNAWYTLGGMLSSKEVISKSFTPFGEQIGEQVSGFGYNGEYYNAATGMVYLRARFYEPEMNRFSQKDVVRGSVVQPGSLNRYSYVQNDPVNFIDPSGQSLKSVWNSVKSAAQNAVTSVKNTVSKVATAVKNVFTGGSSSSSNTVAPSKPPASSTGTKSSAVYYSTTRSSTTSSAVARSSQSSGTSRAYTPGPIQSTARNFNPNNIMQSTSQAIADARKAADYMNATAPGSPAARQATQAYQETVRLASMANSSNNPNIARQAYQTSQFAVNRANNVATGRLPNTYTPYDSNGNPYSYFNSSRQEGKTPSPDAPRVEDVSPSSAYCNRKDEGEYDTYIIFSDAAGADFTDAANFQMLQAQREGKNVKTIVVNTRAEFEAAWASLPESAAEVYMMFHSNGYSLIFEENSSTEAYSTTGKNFNDDDIGNLATLDHKAIDTLYLYACNSGNIHIAESEDGIGEVLSEVTGGSVIGVDGELSYGCPLISDEFNRYFPRLSKEQEGFHDISGKDASPSGFVEYKDGALYEVIGDLPTSWGSYFDWKEIRDSEA